MYSVWVMENLEGHGILKCHFPALESHGNYVWVMDRNGQQHSFYNTNCASFWGSFIGVAGTTFHALLVIYCVFAWVLFVVVESFVLGHLVIATQRNSHVFVSKNVKRENLAGQETILVDNWSTLVHEKLEKVVESHGISKAHKRSVEAYNSIGPSLYWEVQGCIW